MNMRLKTCSVAVALVLGGWAQAEETAIAPDTATKAEESSMSEVLVTGERLQPLPSLNNSGLDRASVAHKHTDTSDTAKLLDSQPGVSFYGNGGVSSLPAIHGLGDDRVRVKVDGMDLISACANHMNPPLSYIDPASVGSIKVFAGITPVSLGGDSIGGTIQVDSQAPEFAKSGQGTLMKGQAGVLYRSNGNAKGGNLAATIATEKTSLMYSGSTVQSGNYKAAKSFKAAGLAATDRGWLDGDVVGSSRYKSENHALGLAMLYGNHLAELKLGVQHIPYQGFPNQRMDMTGNDSTQINLRDTGRYQWGAVETRVYHEKTRHKMDFGNDKRFVYGPTPPSTVIAPGMPMDTEGRNTGVLVKADILYSERDIFRMGGEYQRYRLNDWWPPSPSSLAGMFISPGVPATTGGMAPNTFWNINNGQRDRFDIFAEWEARWSSQWLSQLGVRSDTVKMNTGKIQGYNNGMMYGDPAVPTSVPGAFNAANRQRTDHNWDLTALARYTQDSAKSFEFGYARKTRSPNLYERYSWSTNTMAMEMINFAGDGNYYIGNLNLKPEVANTLSVTADWRDAAREQWGLKVTPYYTYVQDYIDVRRCPAGTVCSNTTAVTTSLTAKTGFVYLQFANQSARLYGVDISGYVPLAENGEYGSFRATGVVSYVDGKNQTTGDNLYNIMPLNAKLAVVQRVAGWTNSAEIHLVSAKTQVSQVRNELKTGGYGLLNLRSSYEWKRARVDISLENALNKFYASPLGGAYVGQGSTMSGSVIPWGIPIPGMGRSINTGLTVKF